MSLYNILNCSFDHPCEQVPLYLTIKDGFEDMTIVQMQDMSNPEQLEFEQDPSDSRLTSMLQNSPEIKAIKSDD